MSITHSYHRRLWKSLGVILAVVAGLAVSVQARINGQLAADLGDSVLAALVSFGGGLVLLLVLVLFIPSMRSGLRKLPLGVRDGQLRPWYLLGGLGGASLIAAQATTAHVLGVAMFTIGVVSGQTISGLLVDKAGLGPAGPRPLSPRRLAGAALLLVAVGVATWGGLEAAGSDVWLLVLPLGAGFAVAVQQAINGRVSGVAGSPMSATLVNFTVGTAALALGWGLSVLLRGGPSGVPSSPVLYLGGVLGVAFIAIAALVVHRIGVLLLGLASIAGQLIGSLLLDVFLPTRGAGPAVGTAIGVVIALVAVGVAAAPGRRVLPSGVPAR